MAKRKYVRIVFNNIPEIVEEVQEVLQRGIREMAIEVQARAMQNVRSVDAIDTGNLVNSIYVRWEGKDTRPSALVVGGRFYSEKQGTFIEVDNQNLAEEPKPVGKFKAYVGVAANYGMYVEYGTYKMAARPFLTPAGSSVAKDVRPQILKEIKEVIAKNSRK